MMKHKYLAMTFDDGPGNTVMPEILKLLNKYGAKATFFEVGENITPATAPVLREAEDQGHEIGNHSQSHLHMTQLTQREIQQEVAQAQDSIMQITGIAPTLFRPPYLDVDECLLSEISMPFIGGYSNKDWDAACKVAERVAYARRDARDGAIMLMHCFEGNEATVEALRILLPEWTEQNYEIVTVSQLFAARGVAPKAGVLYECLPPAD